MKDEIKKLHEEWLKSKSPLAKKIDDGYLFNKFNGEIRYITEDELKINRCFLMLYKLLKD